MKVCNKCGVTNEDESLFCRKCGAKFIRRCSKCGAVNDEHAMSCEKCGALFTSNESPLINESNNKKSGSIAKKIVIVLVVLFAVGLVVYFVFIPSRKDLEKSANSNAKLAYTTATNKLADIVADGGSCDDEIGVRMIDCNNDGSTEVEKYLHDAFEDWDNPGYVVIEIDSYGSVVFAAWASDKNSDVVGYYGGVEGVLNTLLEGKTLQEVYDLETGGSW